MPKLDETAATTVAEAEEAASVMEEGIYEMILVSVEAKEGPKGPYWNWTFRVPEDAPKYAKWQQWLITSLTPESAWRLKETFKAFDATPDTDTDDLIGKTVRVQVGVRTIQSGARAGEIGNQIKKVMPLSGDAEGSGNSNLF